MTGGGHLKEKYKALASHRRAIIVEYAWGVGPKEISRRYNHSDRTVYKVLKEHGIHQKGRRGSAAGVTLKPNGYLEYTMGKDKFRSVHRVRMEQHIGRKLDRREHVHHINGDRSDNRIENLQLMTIEEHMSHHIKDRVRNLKGQLV